MKEDKYGLSDDGLVMGSLIAKYIRDEINIQEKALLDQWIAKSEKNKQLFEELTDIGSMHQRLEYFYNAEGSKEVAVGKVMEENFPADAVTRRMSGVWRRIMFAAAVILLLATGAYFWYNGDVKQGIAGVETGNTEIKNDVSPGKAKAVLTLSNGHKIVLDSSSSQMVGMQGNAKLKNQNGQLIYIPGSNNGSEMVYNTLSTTKGQTYATVLADGSKVWLNSASSIRYPVAFYGKERLIEIEGGEAYFEVAHNKTMPFKVSVNGIQVVATGTSFNIQAYSDEPLIRTTLLEGGVRITPIPTTSGSEKTVILKPGQQAQIKNNGSVAVADIDLEEVTAWKNDMFVFNNTNIKVLMRQLERWYNVQTEFKGKVDELTFTGQISRYSNISKVIRVLELSGVAHFKLENVKIVVIPKQ